MTARGGFGGGRGGRSAGPKLPFDYDPELEGDLDVKPSEMFPVSHKQLGPAFSYDQHYWILPPTTLTTT
jgi:hypothetical protein